jgi:hypothetical protein
MEWGIHPIQMFSHSLTKNNTTPASKPKIIGKLYGMTGQSGFSVGRQKQSPEACAQTNFIWGWKTGHRDDEFGS